MVTSCHQLIFAGFCVVLVLASVFVRAVEVCERAMVSVPSVFLGQDSETARIGTRPMPPRRRSPCVMSPSIETFLNCVAGSMQTWCEWLGGNVTSGVWYNDV